jgi:hypothetical protein
MSVAKESMNSAMAELNKPENLLKAAQYADQAKTISNQYVEKKD